jgi:hypothetical protein
MSTLHQQIKERILKDEPNSQAEVTNTFGRADIVTPKEVIEVSNIIGYKEAYGRVLAYTGSPTFSSQKLTPRLHLFCDDSISYHNFEKHVLQVAELCKNRIRLTFGTHGTFCISEILRSCVEQNPTVPVPPPVATIPQQHQLPLLSTPLNTSTPSKIKKFNRFKN